MRYIILLLLSTSLLAQTSTIESVYSSEIILDGNLSEDVWKNSNFITFTNTNRSDNIVKVMTVWDDEYLYFGYDVTDSITFVKLQETRLWMNDGAELYLDMSNNKTQTMDSDDYHFVSNIGGLSTEGMVSTYSVTTSGDTTVGYEMEIAISWSLLDYVPEIGNIIGVLIANNDRDNDYTIQFDWLGVRDTGSYARPYLWGELLLIKEQIISSPSNLRIE